jgi:hypothetical protein
MDAVTYPHPSVIGFLQESMIPLKVAHDAQPLAADFNVKWTPTLITLGPQGKEHHRSIGFLSPPELIPSLILGMAKWHFDSERIQDAASLLEKILTEFSGSDSAPEAIYLLGVSRYKITHDPKPLKEAYARLQSEFPASEWTKRASPYRLL